MINLPASLTSTTPDVHSYQQVDTHEVVAPVQDQTNIVSLTPGDLSPNPKHDVKIIPYFSSVID